MRDQCDGLWAQTAGDGPRAPGLMGDVEADVVIIGGGFTGCSAALHLARSGAGVCLLEARTVGYGGSGRNVGLVNPGLWLEPERVEKVLGQPAGARLNEALAAGPSRVFSLIGEFGIDCDLTRSGTLHCAHSAGGLENLRERLRQYRARGWDVDLLDAEETEQKTGTRMYRASLWDHRAGTIQPMAYVRGLARAAMSSGARLFEMSPAVSVERSRGRWMAATPGGSVRADAVIICTNAYHQGVGQAVRPGYIPVNFFQMATGPIEAELADGILAERQGAWDTMRVMSSFRVDGARRLVIGAVGSLEGFGSGAHRAWARRRLDAMYPRLAGCDFEYAWSGCIAMTSDHIPRIVKFGEQAFSVYGYSGRGIAPGTVFGASVADYLLSGNAEALPLAPVTSHHERLTGIRGVGYELGATAFHLAGNRVG